MLKQMKEVHCISRCKSDRIPWHMFSKEVAGDLRELANMEKQRMDEPGAQLCTVVYSRIRVHGMHPLCGCNFGNALLHVPGHEAPEFTRRQATGKRSGNESLRREAAPLSQFVVQ